MTLHLYFQPAPLTPHPTVLQLLHVVTAPYKHPFDWLIIILFQCSPAFNFEFEFSCSLSPFPLFYQQHNTAVSSPRFPHSSQETRTSPKKLTKYTLTAQEVALAIPSGQMQVMLSEFFSWMQVPPCWQGHLLGSGNSVSTAESQQKQGQQSFLALPSVW